MPRFTLIYDAQINDHLEAIEPKHHSLIRSTIEEQLSFDPDSPTRSRKPLKRPMSFGAGWELRLGPGHRFRVFYRVDTDRHEVRILAIGVKERNRIWIAGENMRTATVAEMKASLDSYVKASAAGPVVVTRNGKPVAVLLGVNDKEDVERLVIKPKRTLAEILEAADRRLDESAGIPHDEFWQQVEARHRPKPNGKKRR
jgi:prevent-host-death family protein